MPQTILVVGATGNTGRNVVKSLPNLLQPSDKYRILALTRDLNTPVVKELAKVPHVEFFAKDWTSIDAAWLCTQNVGRVFIAPHNGPDQFTDETGFYVALLEARVEYVVRISTLVKYLTSTNKVYYGRTHWAVEQLLAQPEYQSLHWTSLQPNFYSSWQLAAAVGWIKEHTRGVDQNAEQSKLSLMQDRSNAVAMVCPDDIGLVAAKLLSLVDVLPHNGKKYMLSGPEDVSGEGVVQLIEHIAHVKVLEVQYRDVSFLDQMITAGVLPRQHLSSMLAGFEPLWSGECNLAQVSTSPEIYALGVAPKTTPMEALRAMLGVSA